MHVVVIVQTDNEPRGFSFFLCTGEGYQGSNTQSCSVHPHVADKGHS